MQKRWVVEVELSEEKAGGQLRNFVECLRYAGIVDIIRDDGVGYHFQLAPPRTIGASESRIWAEMNVRRMSTMGWKVRPVMES